MEELYAQKLDISDDRVKVASISEATFTVKAYAESAQYFPIDPGVKIADKTLSLKEAFESGMIPQNQYKASVSGLYEMNAIEYATREEQALVVKEDTNRTLDERAAAEIIQDISNRRRIEKTINRKYYASNYFDHMVRSSKIRFVKRDQTISKIKELELDKRTQQVKALNEAVILKYSNVKTFADRLLSISSDAAAKKLSAPVQQNGAFQYKDL